MRREDIVQLDSLGIGRAVAVAVDGDDGGDGGDDADDVVALPAVRWQCYCCVVSPWFLVIIEMRIHYILSFVSNEFVKRKTKNSNSLSSAKQ